jgi:hypothetical protein
MSKLIGFACTLAFLAFFAKPGSNRFLKYKAVEAYEIRPGILMMPTYSPDGEVCQIVVEREHYFNGIAHLDSTMPHDVVNHIIDELVPDNERGPLTTDKEMARLSIYGGNSATSFSDYENVSIDISRLTSSPDDIVALVKWKHLACK